MVKRPPNAKLIKGIGGMAKITRDSTEIFHDYDLHIPTKTMYLGSTGETDGNADGVNYLVAERAVKNLHLLDNSGEGAITIVLNSPGGDFSMGQAIYDAVRTCKNRVVIKAIGECMSAASFIIQAADERLMYENCTMMLHYGEAGFNGDPKSMVKWSNWNIKGSEWMELVYLEKIREINPSFSREKLKKMLSNDYIIDAKEALVLGLVDGIITPTGVRYLKNEEE